jgi:hypothetical protein
MNMSVLWFVLFSDEEIESVWSCTSPDHTPVILKGCGMLVVNHEHVSLSYMNALQVLGNYKITSSKECNPELPPSTPNIFLLP